MRTIKQLIREYMISKQNLEAIDNLENEHMLDNAVSSINRFKSINSLMVETYSPYYVWRRWLVR